MLSAWLNQHIVATISVVVSVVVFFVGLASSNIASAVKLENRVTIIEQEVVALSNIQQLYSVTSNKHMDAITVISDATNRINVILAVNTTVLKDMSSVIGKWERDKEVLSDLKVETAVISTKVEEIQKILEKGS